MKVIISIDSTNRDSIAAALAAGVATPESMAAWLYDQTDGFQDAECVDGVLLLEPDTWWADDGNAAVENAYSTAQDAAEEYVSSGDWDEGGSIAVSEWHRANGSMVDE